MAYETRFFNIDVRDADLSDLPPDWDKAHAYSRRELEDWMATVPEVSHLVHEKGYTQADFERLQAKGDSRDQTVAQTYFKLYSQGPLSDGRIVANDEIVVVRDGDHYGVTNGRHRLAVAQELGIKTVPAIVRGENPNQLHDLEVRGYDLVQEQLDDYHRPDWERTQGVRPEVPTRER